MDTMNAHNVITKPNVVKAPQPMNKIGIYSGTFDPIHFGHISFAEHASTVANLDRVYLLAEPTPRRKQGVKALEHRVNMIDIAIKNNPKLGQIILKQQQFTIEKTLPVLKERFKNSDIYMLMGDDFMKHLPEWPNISSLPMQVTLVVAKISMTQKELDQQFSILKSTKGLSFNVVYVDIPQKKYASSVIRNAIKKGQHTPQLSSEVLEYIKLHNLYSSSSSSSGS